MGSYTRIKLDVEIRESAHEAPLALLSSLVAGEDIELRGLTAADKSVIEDAPMVLFGFSGYFEQADGKAQLRTDASGRRHLSFHTSLTNYNGEIEAFCAWLAPLVKDAPGSVVGEVETEDDKWHGRQPALLVVQPSGIAQLRG